MYLLIHPSTYLSISRMGGGRGGGPCIPWWFLEPFYLSIHPAIHPSIYSFIYYLFINSSLCLFIHHLPIHLIIHPSDIYLSINLSINYPLTIIQSIYHSINLSIIFPLSIYYLCIIIRSINLKSYIIYLQCLRHLLHISHSLVSRTLTIVLSADVRSSVQEQARCLCVTFAGCVVQRPPLICRTQRTRT